MWPLCFGFFENSKNNFLFPSTSLSGPRVVECILSLSKLKKKERDESMKHKSTRWNKWNTKNNIIIKFRFFFFEIDNF
jgi:hypothetical protein